MLHLMRSRASGRYLSFLYGGWALVACGTPTSEGSDGSTSVASDTTTSEMTTEGSGSVTTDGVQSTGSTQGTGSVDDTGSSEESTETGEVPDQGLIGWASVAGDGVETTTGGEGGRLVVVETLEGLMMYAGAEAPHVIQISGTIVGIVEVSSNKTIEGLPGARLEGGLIIEDPGGEFVSNVIVRNLTIAGVNCPGEGCTSTDAITVYRAHHVWIDHCDISDGDDGNLDITEESDYVTVSWCRFSFSNPDAPHRLSNLIGASDDAVDDADDLRVTLHHNWWTENIAERMPRVRFGPVHVFNNYYSPADDLYCIRPGFEANLLVENNYFDGAQRPFDSPDDTASILATGNVLVPGPIEEPSQGVVFEPPYPYTLDPVEDVPSIVMAGVGPS